MRPCPADVVWERGTRMCHEIVAWEWIMSTWDENLARYHGTRPWHETVAWEHGTRMCHENVAWERVTRYHGTTPSHENVAREHGVGTGQRIASWERVFRGQLSVQRNLPYRPPLQIDHFPISIGFSRKGNQKCRIFLVLWEILQIDRIPKWTRRAHSHEWST